MAFSKIILALPLVALAFAVPTAVESKPKALEARQGGAGSVVTNSAGLAWYDSNFNDGNSGYSDTEYYYCFYGGASDFPPIGNWMNFYDMFDLNQDDSLDSEESGPIQGQLYNAIVQISEASKVDARVILGVIMQESSGNVYVGCTYDSDGGANCGLMQAAPGSVSYDSSNSQASITHMVQDGTQGTSQGDGYVQLINQYGNVYEAMRAYNSGSVDESDLDNAYGATASYVSDIANRLQGWNGAGAGGSNCGFS